MADSNNSTPQNAANHLANERTLLAWVRTSIGIMAFGFVVVKFSLFLKQLSILLGKDIAAPSQNGYSSMTGVGLVALGAIVLLFAYIKYKRTEKEIDDKNFKSSSSLVFALILIILVITVILISFLVENIIKN
ncbi:MAG: DUF202 domain-containing protein [Bacteroidota bacterium]